MATETGLIMFELWSSYMVNSRAFKREDVGGDGAYGLLNQFRLKEGGNFQYSCVGYDLPTPYLTMA